MRYPSGSYFILILACKKKDVEAYLLNLREIQIESQRCFKIFDLKDLTQIRTKPILRVSLLKDVKNHSFKFKKPNLTNILIEILYKDKK